MTTTPVGLGVPAPEAAVYVLAEIRDGLTRLAALAQQNSIAQSSVENRVVRQPVTPPTITVKTFTATTDEAAAPQEPTAQVSAT